MNRRAPVGTGPAAEPSPVLLADGLLTERLALAAPEGTRVVVADYEIPPGGSLPWHYHDGRVVAVVRAGVLTRTLADGSECVTPAGGCIVEPVGPQGVHMAENRESGPLRICALFFLPLDCALSTRAEPPPAAARDRPDPARSTNASTDGTGTGGRSNATDSPVRPG
ncbi:cupin domain-containing protein [Streptomyces sp. B21-105]|uniref:cupin domain-containing protein n=1 Tax=Streptomyces sp. B21-105 TaxID=3039417 RepID=UPI002FEE699D